MSLRPVHTAGSAGRHRCFAGHCMLLLPALAACLLAIMAAGCNSSGCTEGRSGIPKADFYASATGAAITLDSLRVYAVGAPGDSAIMSPSQRESSVYLPLRSDATTTDWCIAYKQKHLEDLRLADTLHFEYTTDPYFVSEECGVGYRYHIDCLSTTNHLIDSVKLLDPLVTNIDKAYVAIYFRTE